MEQRFWSKVDKRNDNECWEWKAGFFVKSGYGKFWIDGKTELAHRVSIKLNGRDPLGHFVLHSCDNRKCVNPNHLRLGDHLENMKDMVQRDRSYKGKGELHSQARLTDNEVLEIRHKLEKYERGLQRKLSREYGVDERMIHEIKIRKIYKHI